MNCDNNQCCAITHNNKRCQNSVINHSKHCTEHYSNAMKLYKKYKEICDVAYNLDINKDIKDLTQKYNHINNCYIWLNRAFHARLKHRRYAFVPECYDEGHNAQFTLISNKLKLCEDKLFEIHTEYEQVNKQNEVMEPIESVEEDTKPIKNNIIDTIPEEINKQKTKRVNNEKEEMLLVEKYIKHNQKLLDKRDSLNYVCFNIIMNLVEPEMLLDDENTFDMCVYLHHLTRELYSIAYFEPDFKPEKCKECACNNFITYDVTLACACIFRHNTIQKYLNLMSEKALRTFCELMLFHKEKLRPLVSDLIELHDQYGDKLLSVKVILKWSKKLNRLALRESFEPEPIKMSKLMADRRLKKQYFMQKYQLSEA